MQYVELALTIMMSEGYHYYACCQLIIWLCYTMAAYQKRLQLYTSIARHHLVSYVAL